MPQHTSYREIGAPSTPRRKRLLVFNDPRPLRVDRGLATEIGFLESLVLLQIEYHISTTNNLRDGRYWTYQTLSDLRKNDFPWLSLSTISRTLKSLEDMGLLDTGNYNRVGYDRTTWYALNYEGVARLTTIGVGEDAPILQNEKWELYKEKSISHFAKWFSQGDATIPQYSPKEITKENTEEGDAASPRAPAARPPSPSAVEERKETDRASVMASREVLATADSPFARELRKMRAGRGGP